MQQPRRRQATVELNEQFEHALYTMEHTSRNIFITGRAGTGKSTLLDYFQHATKKQVAVLAPTGVAALNVKGQTIHSFFRFKPGITIDQVNTVRSGDPAKNIYKHLDAIVIDEISMVRADLLDCVDAFLRLNGPRANKAFGGVQMAFIGDLYQLPPVVVGTEKGIFGSIYETPYFYSARVLDSLDMEFVELEKVYRQRDESFINLLNAIRNNSVTEEELALLNQRCMPEFEPPTDGFYVYLTTVNKLADEINSGELARLNTALYTFTGRIEGRFSAEYLPTAVDLAVKVGAQIMMVNNDSHGRWVNGSVGKVTDVIRGNGEDVIVAELADGQTVEITPHTWEIYKFSVREGHLESEVIGRFKQYPLMLAWAVTIHKSQGKTFDSVKNRDL